MAEWKKVVVSGSDISELNNDANYLLSGDSDVSLTGSFSGVFTGSFAGDGSQLTGIPVFTVSNEANNRIITSTGSGAGNAEANLTFDGSILNVTGAVSTTGNVTVGGDLIVNGELAYLNVTNLAVEDQFILLGSGSAENVSKGIIFDNFNGTPNQGVAFYWNGVDKRLSYAEGISATATSAAADAYIPLVFDVDNGQTPPIDAIGNIKVEGGSVFIYA